MSVLNPTEVSASPYGRPVIVRYSKYDGTPHWTHGAYYLGQDEYCQWVGAVANEVCVRPGRELTWPLPWVIGFAHDQHYSVNANVQGPGVRTQYYADMTSIATWHDIDGQLEVHTIDLDLDVIVSQTGELIVDDQDEFNAHQLLMAYPKELITATQDACDHVHDGFKSGFEPFATIAGAWRDKWAREASNFPIHGAISSSPPPAS